MTKEMKAAVFNQFGDAEVMRLARVTVPKMERDQIRIKVKAAGLQPVDTKIRSGFFKEMTIDSPQLLGNEFAGIVDKVGSDVKAIRQGEEVIGWTMLSAHAEYVVVDPSQVVRKPNKMSWAQAGALSGSGQTALMALEEIGVSRGDTLLIHAAAGGVGTMAVQLAKEIGAEVIGTASEANHDYLRALGATPVTYGEGLVQRVKQLTPQGVDAAIDAAGPEALHASLVLVPSKDRIITTASRHLAKKTGVKVIRGERSQARLNKLTQLVDNGTLRVHVRKTFNLGEAIEAHREVDVGHGYGKVVFVVGD
ncbi:NADP-dependent oxidoreductase [Caldalkalibacillus salinus]|uniref:NADP-dependent oxidoreductase n=1 Tax=Caldalkalibacillus salinus TaxID=2803787 RepID=UPI001F2BC965|nr:NADP-dependent oxidoreductase [Caldalkalibacillus salinus]